MTFDFGKGRARRQPELLGEDVEDTGKTDESREFSDCSGRKVFQVELALLSRRWHTHTQLKLRDKSEALELESRRLSKECPPCHNSLSPIRQKLYSQRQT